MNIIKIIEKIDDWSMSPPRVYGWFHILFLILMVGITIALCHYCKDSSIKTMKTICLISEVILLGLEVIKQVVNSYSNDVFSYDWGSFPFQFCETPMYVLPIILLNKNKKVQDVLITYMSTFALFAGFCIMICPITVLNSSIFSNTRALTQHGIQVVIGIYLVVWNRKNFDIKNFFYATIMFVFLCLIAISINFIVESRTGADIRMFYLSKDHESAILIVRKIKPFVPFFVYVLSYMVGFTACAFITFNVESCIYNSFVKRAEKENVSSNC